ncbi:MAG: hypothetical protein KDC45_03890 [Bacteroidetes bacterium]|nr:hypothetical protein [Bacteroidota bacterium]
MATTKRKTKRKSAAKSNRAGVKKSPKAKAAKQRPGRTYNLSPVDVEKIAHSLGVETQNFGNHYRLYLNNEAEGRRLTLEIYPDIPIGKRHGALITVYTPNAHLQLQFCSGYVVSEMLGEVTFVGLNGGKLSGLIIEKDAACSFYANVDSEILSGDVTKLAPEVMMSGIALSLTETLIN